MTTKTLENFFLIPTKSRNSLNFKEKRRLDFHPVTPRELSPSYFVSAIYDGEKRVACIKLYEPESKKIYFWYDTTGHKPYCITNLRPNELKKIYRLISHPGFDHFVRVKKYDPLLDKEVILTKVVAKDPLTIGGRTRDCIREIIPEEYSKKAKKIVGLDIDKNIIKHSQGKYGSNRCEFKLYNGLKIPFGKETFDAVVSFQTIEHVQDDKNYVIEVYRVLKKRGVFIFLSTN